MTTTATALRTVRWSSAKTCSRKAIYETQDAPARERTQDEQWILARGKALENAYATMLDAAGVEYVRQKAVRWPGGVLHQDFYLPQLRSAIECLSSDNPSEAMLESKLLQLAGQLVYDDECDDVGVLVLLRSSQRPESITLRLNDDWRERVQAVTAKVLAALETGELPERVCRKPAEARGRFCQFAEHCFADWTPEPLPSLDDPKLRTLATALYEVRQRERPLKGELSSLEGERKDVEAQLVELLEPGSYEVGPLKLTRTAVERKPTLDLRKAVLAGFPVDTLAEWLKPGASFSTFKVERVSEEPLVSVEEFGEDTPW